MTDQPTISQIAQRFSIPHPIVSALDGKTPSVGLLASYGLDEKQAKNNEPAVLTIMAHALSQAFQSHNDLPSALSQIFSGNPNAHNSPTSPVGGLVNSVLSDAALAQPDNRNFMPHNPGLFQQIASGFGDFLKNMKAMGGPVTNEQVNQWSPQKQKPQAPHMPGQLREAPKPQGPEPGDVENFAGQMKGLGVDINHFMQNFPLFSALQFKMLQSKSSLEDFAATNGMDQNQIMEHVRNKPHPTYPQITGGQYADAHDMAMLHSVPNQGRTPHPAEVARLASSGAKWKEMGDFYRGPQGGS